MEILISGKDKKQLKKIEDMALKMGLNVERKKQEPIGEKFLDNSSLLKLMKDMAASGGIKSIKNPVEWQKSIRKDKPLPDRA